MIGRPYYIVNKPISWAMLSNNTNAVTIMEDNIEKAHWSFLSANKSMVHLLSQHIDKINWECICTNENAVPIIKRHLDKLTQYMWGYLGFNPNAVSLVEDKVNELKHKKSKREKSLMNILFERLSQNPNAIHLLENNLDKINWRLLSSNQNAMSILENNLEKVYWDELSENPNAIHILEKNVDKIIPENLSKNPNALDMLEKKIVPTYLRELLTNTSICKNSSMLKIVDHYVDQFDYANWIELAANEGAIPILEKYVPVLDKYTERSYWSILSRNPNAIHILEKYPDKISWGDISQNPNAIHMFTRLDYEKMINHEFKDELISYVFNPMRIKHLSESYNISFNELLCLY
jgi:hypothetical protein